MGLGRRIMFHVIKEIGSLQLVKAIQQCQYVDAYDKQNYFLMNSGTFVV